MVPVFNRLLDLAVLPAVLTTSAAFITTGAAVHAAVLVGDIARHITR